MTRLVLPLALLLTTACDEPFVACTDDLRYGISLTVIDEAGEAVPGTEVTYTVDGGDAEICDGADGEHACGPEVAGTYELTIEAEGFETQTLAQDVGQDECHVIPEVIEVTLTEDTTSS